MIFSPVEKFVCVFQEVPGAVAGADRELRFPARAF